MPLLIRRYLPSDREAVWNLHVSGLQAVGARASNPAAERLDADLGHIESVYLEKKGEFLVGSLDGVTVAMGGLKRMSIRVAEITRMRVHPSYWRRGYGELLLRRLEAAAANHGYTELWLDTLDVMTAAERLYRKNGFEEFLRVPLRGYQANEAILFRKKAEVGSNRP